MEPESYLKSGTNELKILEFSSAGLHFGLNVLKTSRVITAPPHLTTTAQANPAVVGIIEEHGTIVPIIDLAVFLELKPASDGYQARGRVLITEFFGQHNGFLVDNVHVLHTILWERVLDADNILGSLGSPYVIGIVKPDDDSNIQLLDYEKIILELSPEIRESELQKGAGGRIEGGGRQVLIAEDSQAVRDMLAVEFGEQGFEIITAKDGKQAWALFQERQDNLALVVSDVEMPQLEGLSLTKMIKEVQPETPVIVYSSIGDLGMKERAREVGADAHVSKLNIEELFGEVAKLL